MAAPCIFLAVIALWTGCASHPGPSGASKGKKPGFESTRRALEGEDYESAASNAWNFIRTHQPVDEDYENAQFALARSLDRLKFHHAALEYYLDVVRQGGASELIVESLGSALETIEKRPYDQYLVETELISGSEFEFLPAGETGQVRFIRGKIDFERGDMDWAKKAFDSIEPKTAPWFKVRYALAVQELKEGRPDQATTMFEEIAKEAPKGGEIRNRALQSLARMLYEEKKYIQALEAYDQIDKSVLLWDEIFLEKAWNAFQLGMHERALGHLHALHAPIFTKTFQPERFLLLGMILRQICRYEDVRGAIAAFRERFGPSITHIQKGLPLDSLPMISQAARTRKILKARADFLESVVGERDRLAKSAPRRWKSVGLTDQLKAIYDLKYRQIKTDIEDYQEKALKEVASDLLYYNEQMNLLEYEVRMDEFRRSRFYEAKPSEKAPEAGGLTAKVIQWQYKGEFWIDELDRFTVKVENRCDQ